MHHRPPERSEQRLVPWQLETTLGVDDGIDPRRWSALALPCGAFFMVLLRGTITIMARAG